MNCRGARRQKGLEKERARPPQVAARLAMIADARARLE